MLHNAWFHLYETFKWDKTTMVEKRSLVARGYGWGKGVTTEMGRERFLGRCNCSVSWLWYQWLHESTQIFKKFKELYTLPKSQLYCVRIKKKKRGPEERNSAQGEMEKEGFSALLTLWAQSEGRARLQEQVSTGSPGTLPGWVLCPQQSLTAGRRLMSLTQRM